MTGRLVDSSPLVDIDAAVRVRIATVIILVRVRGEYVRVGDLGLLLSSTMSRRLLHRLPISALIVGHLGSGPASHIPTSYNVIRRVRRVVVDRVPLVRGVASPGLLPRSHGVFTSGIIGGILEELS